MGELQCAVTAAARKPGTTCSTRRSEITDRAEEGVDDRPDDGDGIAHPQVRAEGPRLASLVDAVEIGDAVEREGEH